MGDGQSAMDDGLQRWWTNYDAACVMDDGRSVMYDYGRRATDNRRRAMTDDVRGAVYYAKGTMDNGPRAMPDALWSLGYGQRAMDDGRWPLGNGQRALCDG